MDTTEDMATTTPDTATITTMMAPRTRIVTTMQRGMATVAEWIPPQVPTWVHRRGPFSTTVDRLRLGRSGR